MTITLYHGSDTIIERPEIRIPNRTLDFGKGFYLTSSEKQASDWVLRRTKIEAVPMGYVNIYDFSFEDAEKALIVKHFDHPSEEWLDFVMSNRQNPGFEHNYDIVIGPVANDRVYTAFSLYEGGTISKDILIKELKTYRLVDQFLFHTAKSLEYLKFVRHKIIEI